jgi:hypothetical protein
MLIRTLPSKVDALSGAIDADIEKECLAATSKYHPIRFNWDEYFLSRIQVPLALSYPLSDVQRSCQMSLGRAEFRFQKKVFYPQVSNKTIGGLGRVYMEMNKYRVSGLILEPTTRGLELLYSRTGIMIEGETEMRTSFLLNDLRPRTYYARGPTVYYPSRFIQSIFNIICDEFPVTNRYQRFILSQIRLGSEDTLFIYDYSSFTSKLHEILNFTAAIGRFYEDIHVKVVDSFLGPIDISLGDLMEDFNQVCNFLPEFSIPDQGPGHPKETNFHNCGMLGVPGNITSCTLLHGIHLAVVLCNTLCRCVGDDAIGSGIRDEVTGKMLQFLGNIGDISMPKTQRWDVENDEEENTGYGWHYTKRPISRVAGRVSLGWQLIFPPITYLVHWDDPIRTNIWPKTDLGYMQKHLQYGRSFALSTTKLDLSESQKETCETFLKFSWECYKRHLNELPASEKTYAKKQYPSRCGSEDFFWELEHDLRNAHVGYVTEPALPYNVEDGFVRERVYRGRMAKVISYAVSMEWCVAEKVKVLASGEEFVSRRKDDILSITVPAYDWSLLPSCPSWLVDLVRSDLSLSDPSIFELETFVD